MAAVVFVALCAAVLFGQGILTRDLTFANQTAGSAILVMALSVGADSVFQRLQAALIGGGVALLLSILLFPPDPHTALRNARIGVFGALHDMLAETADRVGGDVVIPSDWQYSAVDQLHERLEALNKARTHARHLAWIAPRRWVARGTVQGADQQAAQLALLAGSLLYLGPYRDDGLRRERLAATTGARCDRRPRGRTGPQRDGSRRGERRVAAAREHVAGWIRPAQPERIWHLPTSSKPASTTYNW